MSQWGQPCLSVTFRPSHPCSVSHNNNNHGCQATSDRARGADPATWCITANFFPLCWNNTSHYSYSVRTSEWVWHSTTYRAWYMYNWSGIQQLILNKTLLCAFSDFFVSIRTYLILKWLSKKKCVRPTWAALVSQLSQPIFDTSSKWNSFLVLCLILLLFGIWHGREKGRNMSFHW